MSKILYRMTKNLFAHSLRPSLDATLRAAYAVQIGCPADLSRENGNPVDSKTPYKECLLTGFPLSWEWKIGVFSILHKILLIRD